jgi:hypothetical protein
MGMGTYFFVGQDGQIVEHEDRHYHKNGNHPYTYTAKAWAKPLVDFIDEWDEHFKLTGEPMRFTAEGEVVGDF